MKSGYRAGDNLTHHRNKRQTNYRLSTSRSEFRPHSPTSQSPDSTTHKKKGLLRSAGQRIVTRNSRPSLTSCRTTELTGSHLPFLSPHGPATLGTRSLSDFSPSSQCRWHDSRRRGLEADRTIPEYSGRRLNGRLY